MGPSSDGSGDYTGHTPADKLPTGKQRSLGCPCSRC